MSLKLFAHPFSSYCQKVLISLYENELDFDYCMLEGEEAAAELERLWPLGKFPVLVDEGQVIAESSIMVEYLGLHHPGSVKLVPEDPRQALEVRFMDRYFDNYIMTPMQAIVADAIRPPESRDPFGVADVQRTLDKAYQWLNDKMADRPVGGGK